MSQDSDPPPHSKLPLANTITLSYSDFFQRFADVLRISWLWLVIAALLIGLKRWQQWSWMGTAISETGKGMPPLAFGEASRPIEMIVFGNLTNLVTLIAAASIAVAWHRRIILDERPGFSGSNIATENAWRYIGVVLAICMIVGLPTAAIYVAAFYFFLRTATGFALLYPLAIPVVYAAPLIPIVIGLRLSVLLPARAAGDTTITFKEAWNRTRGNTWRMFWGVVACTLPPYVLVLVLMVIGSPALQLIARPTSFSHDALAWSVTFASALSAVLELLTLPVLIGFLSHAYRHFLQVPAR